MRRWSSTTVVGAISRPGRNQPGPAAVVLETTIEANPPMPDTSTSDGTSRAPRRRHRPRPRDRRRGHRPFGAARRRGRRGGGSRRAHLRRADRRSQQPGAVVGGGHRRGHGRLRARCGGRRVDRESGSEPEADHPVGHRHRRLGDRCGVGVASPTLGASGGRRVRRVRSARRVGCGPKSSVVGALVVGHRSAVGGSGHRCHPGAVATGPSRRHSRPAPPRRPPSSGGQPAPVLRLGRNRRGGCRGAGPVGEASGVQLGGRGRP